MANIDQQLFPEPYIILLEQLKPFTLGHYFLLKRLNISRDNLEQPGALLTAVFICKYNPLDSWHKLQTGEFFDWKNKKFRWAKKKKIDWKEESQFFLNYLEENSRHFNYWIKEDVKSKSSDDNLFFAQVIVSGLKIGLKVNEIINEIPLGALLSLILVDFNNNGIIKIKTKEDEELSKLLKP